MSTPEDLRIQLRKVIDDIEDVEKLKKIYNYAAAIVNGPRVVSGAYPPNKWVGIGANLPRTKGDSRCHDCHEPLAACICEK